MSNPQAVTPTDEKLEKLIDAFHIAAPRLNLAPELIHNSVTGNALERQYTAARAALRAYLSEDMLTREEANAIILFHESYKTDKGARFGAGLFSKLRRASMKEHLE